MKQLFIITILILLSGTAFAQICEPDLVNYTPTPTLKWNAAEPGQDCDEFGNNCVPVPIMGYRLEWHWLPNEPWCCYADLDCQIIPFDDEIGGSYTICPGVDYDVPVQRFTNTQLEELSFAVRAYDVRGMFSIGYSNEVIICMPQLWRF